MMTAEEISNSIRKMGLAEPLDPDAMAQIRGATGNEDALAMAEASETLKGQAELYLRGLAFVKSDEPDEALSSWLTLCDHLAQAGQMVALKALSSESLDTCDSPAAARFLLQACAATQDRDQAKSRAGAILRSLPKDPRAKLVAGRALQDEGKEGAAALYADAFERALRKTDDATAEEAFLYLIELDDHLALSQAGRALMRAPRGGKATWAAGLMEAGGKKFTEAGLDGVLIDTAIATAKEGADLEPLRATLIHCLKEAHAGKTYLPTLLEITGIESEDRDIRTALMKIEEVFAFPPGRYVRHLSFGVGPVIDTDGESVVINFPEKGEKRMSINMANKALLLLPPEDIRVQLAQEKDEMEVERKADPVAVLVRGLKHLGDEGTAKQLKETLTPEPIGLAGWNTWWRKARAAALQDSRINTSTAFKELFRLATGDEEDSLPDLPSIKDRAKALKHLKKFLKDQPDRMDDAREAWIPCLKIWLTETIDLKTRTRILLQLDKWTPDEEEQWAQQIGLMFAKGVEVSVVTTAEDQKLLFELGLKSQFREQTALQALTSRFATIRDKAMHSLQEGGSDLLISAIRKILGQGQAMPIYQVARWYADGGEGGFDERLSPWRMVAALMSTLTSDEDERTEKALLELFDPEGTLAKRLCDVDLPEDLHGSLRMGLRSLRSHFQLSHGALQFLEATGVKEAILKDHGDDDDDETVDARRKDALQASTMLISRATARRFEKHVETYKRDLQTSIPAEILTAREHGDLKENAEYKAAKEKQALTVQKLDELMTSLSSVRFLEDLPWGDGRIIPGCYIQLEDASGNSREFWLLGDREDYLGDMVISHRSPLAESLLWKHERDLVTLAYKGKDVEYTIKSIERRIPTLKDAGIEK